MIEFTDDEFAEIEAELKRRNQNADTHDARHKLGWSTLANQTLGVVGERVVAKALGLSWAEVQKNYDFDKRKSPDVGGFEVRTTYKPNGDLVIRPDDYDDRIYVLVVPFDRIPNRDNLRGHRWIIGGCIKGALAKQQRFWRTDRGREGDPPAWFVPQQHLIPFAR